MRKKISPGVFLTALTISLIMSISLKSAHAQLSSTLNLSISKIA